MKIKSLIFILLFVSCSVAHAQAALRINSVDIAPNATIDNKFVFNGFGCSGDNTSPQISWSGAPIGTKSFAYTVYDPDAPTGSGWWHYLAVNIPVKYKELPTSFSSENTFSVKDGIKQIRNDFGIRNFGGPCPPQGDKAHRYVFTIYALKVEKLDVSENMPAANAGFLINQNIVGKATFTGFYKR